MSIQTNKIIHINNEHIFGATTLKDITLPEKNNTALHVCIDPEAVMINRKRLAEELNMPLDHWALPWQNTQTIWPTLLRVIKARVPMIKIQAL